MLFTKQTQYNSGPSVDQLWELDIDKRKWALLQTSVASNNESNSPGPRSSHTILHYKGDLYVFGGYSGIRITSNSWFFSMCLSSL